MFFSIYIVVCLAMSGSRELPEMVLPLNGPALDGTEWVMVRGFVSFPMGVLAHDKSIQVLSGDGGACPADLQATARWPDDSIRCLAVKAMVKARQARTRLRLKKKKSGPAPALEILCRRFNGSSHEIQTGPLKMILSPGSAGMIETLQVEGREFLDPEKSVRLEIDLKGEKYRDHPPREVLVNPGPCETEVWILGATRSRFSGQGPNYTLRLFLHAGSTRMDGSLAISGGEDFQGCSEGILLTIQPADLGRKPRIRLTDGQGRIVKALHGEGTMRLQARKGSLSYSNGVEEEVLDSQGGAGILMDSRGRTLGMGLPDFVRLHPWSAGFSSDHGLYLSLLADSFQWDEGLFCERDFFLVLKKGVPLRRLSVMKPMARAAAFGLSKKPALRAFPFLTLQEEMASDPLFQLYLHVSDLLMTRLEEEQKVWDGFRDHGDYRMHYGRYGNCEFDPAYGLLKRFCITRHQRDFRLAETMLKHWLRFDRTRPDDPDHGPGLPWVHGLDHESGEVEPGHMWVDGALLFYYLTGESSFQDAARDMSRYLIQAGLYNSNQGLERSAAWGLMALTALQAGGEPGLDQAMNRLAARICKAQAKAGYFTFERVREEDESFWAANTWVTSGITMEALYRHFQLTGDARSCETLVRAAKWLVRKGRDETTGAWFQRLLYSEKKPALLMEKKGKVKGEDGAFLALGLARAGNLTRNKSWMAQSRTLLEQSLEALKSRPPRYPGRALSMILRTAPEVILSTGKWSRHPRKP